MKKVLALAIIATLTIFSCRTAKAQTSNPVHQMLGSVRGLLGDTVTNTGTGYDSIILNQNYSNGLIEVQCTKISGTLGGVLKIQACNTTGPLTNFSHWNTLNDSATVTNTTGEKSYYFQIPSFRQGTAGITQPVATELPYYIYRILWTGTGTMSGSIKSYACLRLKQ